MQNLHLPFSLLMIAATGLSFAQGFGSGTNSDVDWSNLTSGTQCRITGQSVSEASNQIDWQRAWNRLTGRPGETAPRVYDFARKKVVIITLGERRSGGYSVFVSGIRRSTTGSFVLDATERTPAPGSYVSTARTTPYTVITVDKSAARFVLNLSLFEPQPAYDPYYDPYYRDGYGDGYQPTNPPITGNGNDSVSPVDWSVLSSGVRSRASRTELLVATSAADYQRKYANLTGMVGAAAPSNVNWSREVVVIVTLGTRRSGGYSVFVKGLRSGPNRSIIVDAVEKSPNPGSFVSQEMTSPWTMIKMEKTNAKILLNLDYRG
jgi:predicted RNA-binding protein with TRAM domain